MGMFSVSDMPRGLARCISPTLTLLDLPFRILQIVETFMMQNPPSFESHVDGEFLLT